MGAAVSARRTKARKGFETREDAFVRIPHALIVSAAFRQLRPRAVTALVFLLDGWRPGHTYALPARQCAWRFDHKTLTKALAELVEAGIVDCMDPGGLYPRRPAVFKLSERWRARSEAIMADETAGKAQGKFGLWTPTRTRKPALPRLFKKAKAKDARPTKRAAVVKALAVVRGKKKASDKSSIKSNIIERTN